MPMCDILFTQRQQTANKSFKFTPSARGSLASGSTLELVRRDER